MIFPEKNTWLCAECGKVLAQAYYVDGALLCDGCRKASMKPDRKSYDGSCYVAGMVTGFLVSMLLWIDFPEVSIKAIPIGVWIGLGIAGYVGMIFVAAYVCGRLRVESYSAELNIFPAMLGSVFWPIALVALVGYGIYLLGAKCWTKGLKD